jgi:hypothetical protein
MYIDRIPASRFTLKKFRKSKTRHKKYDAIIVDIKTRKEYIIPFGDNRYEQFRDTTGLGIYRQLDHGDRKRRENYLKRHENTRKKKWSASWFSAVFLWSAPRNE